MLLGLGKGKGSQSGGQRRDGQVEAIRALRSPSAPRGETPPEPAQIMRALRDRARTVVPPLDELHVAARRCCPGALTGAQSAATQL